MKAEYDEYAEYLADDKHWKHINNNFNINLCDRRIEEKEAAGKNVK